MNFKKNLGRRGEKIARHFLIEQGYKILDKNYYTRRGEIDVVALEENIIIFVEVKTRSSEKFGRGEESITDKKLEHLVSAAQSYLHENTLKEIAWRIDLIIIDFSQNIKQAQIRHLKNITF